MSGFPTVSFLEIDGKVLSGEEFEEYCKDHGLCKRCARVRTHRRVLKLFGRGNKWDPMTLHDDHTGEYTVYKGYCLQPTCYTLGQAKRLTGGSSNRGSSRRSRVSDRMKNRLKRPGRRRTKANPDTGSVMSGVDDYSIASDMSGLSQMSGSSAMSGMSGMSGFSGISSFRRGRRKKRSSSASSSASSVSSFDSADDDVTIDSAIDPPAQNLMEGEPSPIVTHRIEQLTTYDYFTVLDLSKVELRQEDIDVVVGALAKANTLESIILDRCKLKDQGMEQISSGLKAGNHINLKKVSVRQNSIGNKGAQSLDFLFRSSPTLEELDLSENSISSRGAASILSALHANQNLVLHTLNLSQNEIWDMDDGSFLKRNKTLRVFNLDGNFMHDEGAEQIANAIAGNKNTVLEKLYLGWNGISDDGATALAKMMEVNSTVQVVGLAENDISNSGARAILSALSVNTSVREISGLYHNQIDRKFIIVAIKRLLHRYGERSGQPAVPGETESTRQNGGDELKEEEKVPVMDEESEASDGSVNWASQLYSTAEDTHEASPAKQRSSVALEAIEHWDWGTFGIEEIESEASPSNTKLQMPDVEPEAKLVEDYTPHLPGSLPRDRITVFRSAPLAYFNPKTSEHHDIPIIDFEYESRGLTEALADKEALGADIEIAFETATPDRLSAFFSQGFGPILHFSGHGHAECLALENGYGYMQAFPIEDLKRLVSTNTHCVNVAFISSCHSLSIADGFIKAGFSHVVCCHREAVFTDEGPVVFAKSFYRALARNKTLKGAFQAGLDGVRDSSAATSPRSLNDRFLLLPKKPQGSDYHDVKVFFQQSLSKRQEILTGDTSMLPSLPGQFVGREVDMYEILESLRVDDVIRIGGSPGSGKTSVIAAVSRYILERPKSFSIGSVFWIPAPPLVTPDEDSLYGDLCQVMKWLVEAEDDIWDEEDYIDCRERIMIELEDQKTILVIDGRIFTTEAAGENLERFLSHLLNDPSASVKIILMTAHEGSAARTKRSRSEETIITMGPLDFKASSLLFGDSCPHINRTGNPMVHSPEEFADFLVPPSVKMQGTDLRKDLSRRQQELYDRMGKGNPRKIVETARGFSEDDLMDMLRFAQRPEVQVDSAGSLDAAMARRTAQQEKAIAGKNYLRAQYLAAAIEELVSLKSKYPSLTDLQDKEKEMKKEFSALLSQKKYGEANKIKRKILALKKDMMKEKLSKPKGTPKYTASGKLQELQAQMDNMLALAERMKVDSTLSQMDSKLKDNTEKATFMISRQGDDLTLEIVKGSVADYNHEKGACGILCWTNENCDLSVCEDGKKVAELGAESLADDISSLPIAATTSWGDVKCPTGDAKILGPRTYSKLNSRFVLLAVSPLSPSNDDEDWDGDANEDIDGLHYLDTSLRASYRSSFRCINATTLEAVCIPTITTKSTGGTYSRSLRVGLQTIVQEAKNTKLSVVQIAASSGNEATKLIKMALEMGLTCI